MSKFLHTYLKGNLFQKIKGRKFKGLENLINNICLKKPDELQERLTCYCNVPPDYQSTDHVSSLDLWSAKKKKKDHKGLRFRS
jgi:hypothetical protein